MLQRLKRQLREKNAAAGGKLQPREKKNALEKIELRVKMLLLLLQVTKYSSSSIILQYRKCCCRGKMLLHWVNAAATVVISLWSFQCGNFNVVISMLSFQ